MNAPLEIKLPPLTLRERIKSLADKMRFAMSRAAYSSAPSYILDDSRKAQGEFFKAVDELLAAAEWVPVTERMPPDLQFVLVKCESGYTTTPFVYTTARRDEAYRHNSWIDHANDRLTDWGMEPSHWRPLP